MKYFSTAANKLFQIIFAMGCWFELDKLGEPDKKSTACRKNAGLRRFTEKLETAVAIILFFGILAYGIIKGWVKIPTYLGDGCGYDNFG